MRLEGQIALVTGGLRGIGRAIADRFAAEGAVVFITDIETTEAATALLPSGERITYIQANVADEADWKSVADGVKDAHGKLDVLVNNAGVDCVGPIQDTLLADWRRIMSINVDGAFLGIQHCHDLLAKAGAARHGGSSIINMASVMGQVGYIDTSAYNTSKGAITLMTKAAAIEFATKKTPIRVNSMHPGFVRTPLFETGMERLVESGAAETTEDMVSVVAEMTPMGRVAEPSEIASSALFLASEESSYMTGSEFTIDGGWTAQ